VEKKGLGIALVGLGGYSTYQLAPALLKTKYCHLAGIVTGNPDKIPIWQKKYDIPDGNVYSYDNMDRIADNQDIDVIYIVVPTGLHAKYAIKAAETGKHVWCEKPMAMNTVECQAIIDACKQNKVQLSIGYRMQHEPNTKTLISYTKSKPFGEQTSITSHAGYAGGGGSGWRFKKDMGGGAMYDMGVYTVNGIRYASGVDVVAVERAQHILSRPELFTEVDETTDYSLLLSNGLVAHGRTSIGENINVLRVDCAKGWYQLSPMQSYNGVVGERSDGQKLDIFVDNQQALQMDDDALAIINKTEMMVPGSEGIKDIAVIEAIFQSAKEGRRIEVNQ
jgi:glucose-fructose oxidoreductase